MAGNTPIVVNTTTTPRTFTGLTVTGGLATYDDRSVNPVSARSNMTLKSKATKAIRTAGISLRVPRSVATVIDGVNSTKVVDYAIARVEFLIPPEWSSAQAADLRVVASNLLLASPVQLLVDDGEFVW